MQQLADNRRVLRARNPRVVVSSAGCDPAPLHTVVMAISAFEGCRTVYLKMKAEVNPLHTLVKKKRNWRRKDASTLTVAGNIKWQL